MIAWHSCEMGETKVEPARGQLLNLNTARSLPEQVLSDGLKINPQKKKKNKTQQKRVNVSLIRERVSQV